MTGIVINNNEYEISTGSSKLEYSSTGDCVSYSVWGENIPANPATFLLTINPDPSDANVYINEVLGNSRKVPKNTTASYSVSKTGYVTNSSSIEMTSDKTINVSLIHSFTQSSSMAADGVVDYSGTGGFSLPYQRGYSWNGSNYIDGSKNCTKSGPHLVFPYPVYVTQIKICNTWGSRYGPTMKGGLYNSSGEIKGSYLGSWSGTSDRKIWTCTVNNVIPGFWIWNNESNNNWGITAIKIYSL